MKRLVDDARALDAQLHATVAKLGLTITEPCALCAAVEAETARATQACPDCAAPLSEHPYGCEPATQTLPGGTTREIRRPKYRPEPEARQMAADRRHGLRYDLCGHCGGMGWLRADRPVSHHEFGRAVRCVCALSPDLWYLTAPVSQEVADTLEPDTRAVESRIPAHPIPPFWRTRRFATFDKTPENTKAFDDADDFADDPGSTFLVIGGDTGRGKTHLAAAVSNVLRLRGVDVEVWPWSELHQTIMAGFGGGDASMNLEIARKRCRTAPVLIVDDLRATETSAALVAEWEGIVDARYAAGLPLLITTNAESKDLNVWAPRAFSRLRDRSRAKWVRIDGPDRRSIPITTKDA